MKKTILVVLFLSVASFTQEKPKLLPLRTEVSPNAPRYQLFVNPNVRADTFLLDTVTGKIWVRTTFTDMQGDPDIWMVQDRIDNDEQFAEWRKSHLSKSAAKAAGIE